MKSIMEVIAKTHETQLEELRLSLAVSSMLSNEWKRYTAITVKFK